MFKKTLPATAVLALAAPAAAQAHVTLQPNTGVAGAYTRLDVRVPNERDDASTNKVEVQFPDGFAAASFEPTPGWDVKVTKKQLAKPIQTDDGEITEGVNTITWTAKSDADAIPPGAFEDFGLSVQIPGKAGDKLTFKALQTYTGGEVVRWIGAEGSDNPAPIVSVTAGDGPRRPRPRRPRRRRRRPRRRQPARRRRQRPRDRRADRRRARPAGRRAPACWPPAALTHGPA